MSKHIALVSALEISFDGTEVSIVITALGGDYLTAKILYQELGKLIEDAYPDVAEGDIH